MRFSLLVSLLVAPFVGGCGSSPSSNNQASCTANLSGAVSFSNVSCVAEVGADANGDGNGTVVLKFGAPPAGFLISDTFDLAPGPAVATYSSSNGTLGFCNLTQTAGTAGVWLASTDPSLGTQGTFELKLTSLGGSATGQDASQLSLFPSAQGSLTCTMTPESSTGAAGTVTLTATF